MTPSPTPPPRSSLVVGRIVGFVEFVFRRSDRSGDIYPDDAAFGSVDGSDPEKIVVLGEGNAIGLGVTSHQLGMAGHVARLLASRIGRGVEWRAIGVPGYRIGSASDAIAANRDHLEQSDYVILMLGITDTLHLTSRRTWRTQLTSTLDALFRTVPRDARVLVTMIPPMDNAGSVSRLARLAAGATARRLNRVTTSVTRTYSRSDTVAFPLALRHELWLPDSHEAPYVGMYSAWGAAVVAELVGEVQYGRAGSTLPTAAVTPNRIAPA